MTMMEHPGALLLNANDAVHQRGEANKLGKNGSEMIPRAWCNQEKELLKSTTGIHCLRLSTAKNLNGQIWGSFSVFPTCWPLHFYEAPTLQSRLSIKSETIVKDFASQIEANNCPSGKTTWILWGSAFKFWANMLVSIWGEVRHACL